MPNKGEGLNRMATITLNEVWPVNQLTGREIKNETEICALGYEEKLRRACRRFNGEFIQYDPSKGSWSFVVSPNNFIKAMEKKLHLIMNVSVSLKTHFPTGSGMRKMCNILKLAEHI